MPTVKEMRDALKKGIRDPRTASQEEGSTALEEYRESDTYRRRQEWREQRKSPAVPAASETDLTEKRDYMEGLLRGIGEIIPPKTDAQAQTQAAPNVPQAEAPKVEAAETEEQTEDKWRQEKEALYSALVRNPDFAELSSRVQTTRGEWWDVTKWGSADNVYEYINDIDDMRWDMAMKSATSGGDPYAIYLHMKDDEIAVYNYLYNKEGRASANAYLDYLEYTLNQRATGEAAERLENYVKEGGDMAAVASAVSVPFNLLSISGYLDVAGQKITKGIQEAWTGEYAGPIDYNTPNVGLSRVVTTIRQSTAEELANKYGVIELDTQEHPILSRLLNGKSLGDVYQLGMSMVDSSVVALLSPVMGDFGAALLGGSAATQGMLNAVEKGGTDGQALIMGLASGTFEMLFEKYSLDKLLKGDTKNIILAALKQGFVEGTEELFTSIANLVTDTLVMMNKSDIAKAAAGYREQGLSEGSAYLQAAIDTGISLLWDFVGGFASGGIMGGGKATIAKAVNRGQSGKQTSQAQQTPQTPQTGENGDQAAEQAQPQAPDTGAENRQQTRNQPVTQPQTQPVTGEAEQGNSPPEIATRLWERGMLHQRDSNAVWKASLGDDANYTQSAAVLRSILKDKGYSEDEIEGLFQGEQAAQEETAGAQEQETFAQPQAPDSTLEETLSQEERAWQNFQEASREMMGVTGKSDVDNSGGNQYADNTMTQGGNDYGNQNQYGVPEAAGAGLPGGTETGRIRGNTESEMQLHGAASAEVGGVSGMVPQTVQGGQRTGDSGVQLGDTGVLRVSEALNRAQQERGTPVYAVRDTTGQPAEYEAALTAGRNSDPVNGWCVTPKTARELAEGNVRTFMNEDGTVGVGIAPDGDIVAVFKNRNGGPKRALDTMMPIAIEQGGIKLDCYGEGLVRVYERYGFVPVARVEFNPEYANEGWTPDKGTPYIYMMMHNGDSAATVVEKKGSYQHVTDAELDALPTYGKEDYDAAMEYRDGLLEENRGAPEGFEAMGAASADFTGTAAYDNLLSDENAQRDRPGDVRPVEVPKVDAKGRDVSEFVGNAYGSALTPDTFIPTIRKLLLDGELSHDTQTNEQTLKQAAEALAKDGDIKTSADRIRGIANSGKTSARTVAEATLLYSYLTEETDDLSQRYAADVFVSLTQLSTNSGRALQVFSLMRKMTTQGQMTAIQETVKRSVADMVKKGIIRKDADSRVDPALMEEFRKAAEDLKRIEDAERREAEAQDRLEQAKEVRREADREAKGAERRAEREEARASEAEKNAQEARDQADQRIDEAESRIGEARERQDTARDQLKEARKEAGKAERKAEREEARADKLEQKLRSAEERTGDARQRIEDAQQRVKDARDAIYLHIASKQAATFKAKWDAFRYMAMLGNVKTQVRNFGGNVGYMPYTELKRVLGAAMELGIKKENRTKALVGLTGRDGQLRAWAKADVKTENVHKALEYSAKLGDDTTLKEIRDNIRVFSWNWLEKTRQFVGDVPSATDMWFKEGEYVRSLAGFLKARGYNTGDIRSGKVTEAVLNEGRCYAISEALKATFNDCNAFSDAISNLRYTGDNPYLKAISIMGEGLLPFRRTPANVVVRAVENSPVNIARSFWNLGTKVRTGEMSAATAIDQMASGLTGTGMMVLGWFLASGALGFLRLRGNTEEEKERQGYQDYAIEVKVGDKWYSYTIDWAAPANIPLFVGANIYSNMSGENGNAGMSPITAAVYAGLNSLDPLLSLSCMSSVNDLFETGRYAEEGTALYSAAASLATNYFTQVIPALWRQGWQAAFPNQRQTFANSEDPMLRELQRKTAGIAGVGEFFRTDKVDEWGETEHKGGAFRQVFDAFFNPGTLKEIDNSALEQEISRLQGSQEESVAPPDTPKTISFTDAQGNRWQNRRLTEKEWNTLRTVQGQTAADILNTMIASADYAALTDRQKAAAFGYVYDYAREMGRTEAIEGYDGMSGWMEGIEGKEAGAIIGKVVTGSFSDGFDSLTAGNADGAVETLEEAYRVYEALSAEQRKAVAEGASGRIGYYLEARLKNIGTETFTDLYQIYREIDANEELTSTQKAEAWAYELQNAKAAGIINKVQADFMGDTLVYRYSREANADKFNEIVESGVDTDAASDLMWLLDGIEPQKGYADVRDVQKAEAIVNRSGLSDKEMETVLKIYLNDAQDENLNEMLDMGYDMEDYVKAYRVHSDNDKKAEFTAALEAMGYTPQEAENIYYVFNPKRSS